MEHIYVWDFKIFKDDGVVVSKTTTIPNYVKTAGQVKQYLIKYLVQNDYPSGWYGLTKTDMLGVNPEEINYKIYFNKR